MDRATPIGIGLALVAIIGANVMEGGNPMSLILIPPMILVIFGTLGAAIAGCTIADLKTSLAALKSGVDLQGDAACRPGPCGGGPGRQGAPRWPAHPRGRRRQTDDEFLKKGVSLAVDGTDPEELREILEAEAAVKKKKAKQDAKFYNDMGGYAPTIGIIGTVMGLVHVLENLSEPDKLGHLIAGAFVATLWGVHDLQRDLAADRQPAHPDRRPRGRPHGDRDRGRAGRAGRLQPARRGPAPPARCSPTRERVAARPRPPDMAKAQEARGARGARQPRAVAVSATPT